MRDEGEGAEVVAWLSPWGHLRSIGQPPPPPIPLLKPMIDLGPLDLEGDLKNRWHFWGTPGEWEARSTTMDRPQFKVGQRNELHGVTCPGSDYKSLVNLGWREAGGDAVEDVVNGGGGGMVGGVTWLYGVGVVPVVGEEEQETGLGGSLLLSMCGRELGLVVRRFSLEIKDRKDTGEGGQVLLLLHLPLLPPPRPFHTDLFSYSQV